MQIIWNYIRQRPSVLLYVILSWVLFALVTTILTTYPLLSEYALKSPSVFKYWETWHSFLVYSYNGLIGGIVNYINTFLFGFWVLCFIVYRKTYITQGTTIMKTTNLRNGTLGSMAAILGGGCIGCGFTFLTNIFGAALGLVLTKLPLRGAEIGIVGSIILLISLTRVIRQINGFVPENTPIATLPASQQPVVGV